MEGSGIVAAVGSSVRSVKVGDAVYGLHFKPPLNPPRAPGFCSEYAVTDEQLVLPKPPGLSFEDAAALLGSAVTAYQSMRRALALMGQPSGEGTLEGKTVFMPAALRATGSVGAQVIKRVFGAEKLIATVSTAKLALVEASLPGVVDQVVDYTAADVVRAVGPGTVDLVYNTQWDLTGTFPLLKPDSGVAVSIASIPDVDIMRHNMGPLPFWVPWVLSLGQLWYDFKLRGTNIKQSFVSGNPNFREDLEKVGEMIAQGQIRAVTTVVDLDDMDAVRRECHKLAAHKGGFGKLVVRIAAP